jgi:hypothetical protein
MQLYGVNGDREKFRKLTSHPQQTIGCELFEALDGDMRAQRILRIRNGELEIEINVDRAFDIGRVLYRGIPTQWVSPAGFRHAHSFTPGAIEPDGWGWLRSWLLQGNVATQVALVRYRQQQLKSLTLIGIRGQSKYRQRCARPQRLLST